VAEVAGLSPRQLVLRLRADWPGRGTVAAAAFLALAGGFLLRTLIVFSPYGAGS
jgi:formate-dependent nitrite reductase membrane component NrfD